MVAEDKPGAMMLGGRNGKSLLQRRQIQKDKKIYMSDRMEANATQCKGPKKGSRKMFGGHDGWI